MNNKMPYPTPKQIVKKLGKYVIGQHKAKVAVAIALRSRWRRLQVEGDLKYEISPKNILMVGSTGVGKTEISRRLADLSDSSDDPEADSPLLPSLEVVDYLLHFVCF